MDTKDILCQAEAIYPQVVAMRRRLHADPKLSFREGATADFITRTLEAEGLACRPIADTGVLVRVEGRGDPGAAVVLRADTDALPLLEATGLPYASQNRGVMHACGHDMHTAALMGAMIVLGRNRDSFCGTVFGVFQPGEEVLPGGAVKVLAGNPFEGYDIRAVYGQHVDPDLPTGVFGFRGGEYMASTDELHITVAGEGGHGAMRGRLHDPVQAAAELITRLLQLGNANGGDSVLSIGRVEADGATNVIPDTVAMQGTMRTFDERLRERLKGEVRGAAAEVSSRLGVDVRAEIREGYPAVVNDHALAAGAAALLGEAFGREAVIALDRRMTGEDFGHYTRRYPSLFYRFGVGGAELSRTGGSGCQTVFGLLPGVGKLHTPTFCPDEGALRYAVAGLVMLAQNHHG